MAGVHSVAPLGRLTKLRVLDLHGTAITSVASLANLTRLVDLDVQCAGVRDLSPLGGRRLRFLAKLAIPTHVECAKFPADFPALRVVRHGASSTDNCLLTKGGCE